MKDAGFIALIRQLLRCETKGQADILRSNVGENYSELFDRVVARFSFKRTLSQNALLHKWFGEIAKHFGDRTANEVKGECHRDIGLTIRLRDEQFNWVWQQTGAKLNREQQAKLLASGCLGLSSGMSTKTLSEYMNEIQRTYSMQGVRLTDPEAK